MFCFLVFPRFRETHQKFGEPSCPYLDIRVAIVVISFFVAIAAELYQKAIVEKDELKIYVSIYIKGHLFKRRGCIRRNDFVKQGRVFIKKD